MMTPLSFTCTFEDHAEALRVHRSLPRGQRGGLRERLLFLWVFLGIAAVVFVVALVEGIYRQAAGLAPAATGAGVAAWANAIAAPLVLWTICFGLLWFAFAPSLPPGERRAVRNTVLVMLAALLLVNAISAVLVGVPAREATPAPPAAESSFLAAFAPWLVYGSVAAFALLRYARGAARRSWDAQPHLRLPQTLELTGRGLRFVSERTTYDYTWGAFQSYREGPNVLLLYVSDVAFQMVPKRALADAARADAFRALLAQHVPCGDPRTGGFPVAAGTPTAPQPVVPLGE